MESKKFDIKAFLAKTLRDNNVVYVLLAFVIISSLISPVFLRWGNLTNILRQQASLTLITMGMLMVILTGGIDLSVGSTVALSCVTFSSLIVKLWPEGSLGHMALAMLIALVVCTIAGTCLGILVSYFNIAAFVASLATMTASCR